MPTSTLCVGDAMVNLDPVIAFQLSNPDNRSLSITDVSVDPDQTDPVKHLCQGGGFNGSGGIIKVLHPDPSLGNFATTIPLKGTVTPAAPVVRSYSDAYVDKTTDPNNPRVWFDYRVIDNGPKSLANSFLTYTVNSGWKDSGWQAYILAPVDMTQKNALPIMSFTPSAVNNGNGTYTFTITDNTIDPDWNDPAKNAFFGGGHDGSPGKARILLSNGAGSGLVPVTFKDVPTGTPVTTTVTGTPGTVIWYTYMVNDNHYVNATAQAKSPTYHIYSGWKSFTLP